MSARASTINAALIGKNAQGNLVIRAETVANTRDVFVATFTGSKLVFVNIYF